MDGPWFEDLAVGQVFDSAPGCTLTEGRERQHQAIVGDRWRLTLDHHLADRVAGVHPASPAMVWNVAIGQSTLATRRVRANLFYRRLALLRQPCIGDTLRTTTTIVALRENSRRKGRAPTGLAALRMQTVDQETRPVLDFYRCAMIPLRREQPTGHADDLDAVGMQLPQPQPDALVPNWDRDAFLAGRRTEALPEPGTVLDVATGDVISGAPELARLTLNVAAVHHDGRAAGGRRLVYGGHTIAVAASQLLRALPDLATVLSWDSCDHLGPVHEGDTLTTKVTVGPSLAAPGGWRVVELRAEVTAEDGSSVLDWRLSALHP
ncbi:acyl dehydratase [Saccharopolyspora terrae]|uniref:Acyl dehydratase n=1 Tax=Saccharopolyspora terrae TaxID=2530384 RepID=A0A4R4VEL8_9PSEU|nr:acyl dehydratase [Saccharopolyspora terrae]